MIRKISKRQLQLGMFIQDLNCRWVDHSFLRSSFMLRHEADLRKIMGSDVGDLYIDTVRGIDLAPGPAGSAEGAGQSGPAAGAPEGGPIPAHPGDPREAMRLTLLLQQEATQVVRSILDDARLGRKVQMQRLGPLVERVIGSVLQNPGALVCLCRIRHGDTCTFEHSVSVCALMATFGHHLALDPGTIRDAAIGGMLHDLGKMRVADHILNKPGKLTPREFEIMKGHVGLGLDILHTTSGINATVIQVVGEHHERLDGTGYPARKRGGDISLLGRMAAIVDVYDALTADRAYKHASEPAAALTRLLEGSESSFDPELVQHFVQAIGIYPAGTLVRLSSGRLAVVVAQGTQSALRPRVRVVYDLVLDRKIGPLEMDLAGPEGERDTIQQTEAPAKWRIDPHQVLLGQDL